MSLILEEIDLPFDGPPLKEVEITFHRAGGWDHKRYVFANEGLNLIKPLPKKHGNLKDIDAIYRAFSKLAENETDEGKLEVYAQLMVLLLHAPTIVEEEN